MHEMGAMHFFSIK